MDTILQYSRFAYNKIVAAQNELKTNNPRTANSYSDTLTMEYPLVGFMKIETGESLESTIPSPSLILAKDVEGNMKLQYRIFELVYTVTGENIPWCVVEKHIKKYVKKNYFPYHEHEVSYFIDGYLYEM